MDENPDGKVVTELVFKRTIYGYRERIIVRAKRCPWADPVARSDN